MLQESSVLLKAVALLLDWLPVAPLEAVAARQGKSRVLKWSQLWVCPRGLP